MANYDCSACETLRTENPNFIVNGMTETECTNLKNDLGLSGDSDDCTDLNLLNDCLVGNMAEEVDAYDVCDWKPFMKKFIPNLWTVKKAIICAICGIWDNIHEIWEHINEIENDVGRIDCVVAAMNTSSTFNITKEELTLAPGVSYRSDDSAIPNISGNAYCAYITGGLHFGTSWTDSTSWLDSDGDTANGGRLVYTYKINLAAHKLLYIWPCPIVEANAGSGLVAHLQIFSAGETTWGNDSKSDSTGAEVVPSGYIYAQVRLMSVAGGWGAASSGSGKGDVTLCGVTPVLMDNSVNC